MMMVNPIIDRMKLMLGIADRDELIVEIVKLVAMPVLLYIKQDNIPAELEWIVVELAIARYNRIGAEGYTEEKNDNVQNRFEENTLDKYIHYLDAWIADNVEQVKECKVRFF